MAKGTTVTPSELLALLGRAWLRLLIYPGGLSLCITTWFAFVLVPTIVRSRQNRRTRNDVFFQFSALFAFSAVNQPPIVLAAPWLAVALLPFPGAVNLGRGIDIVIAMVLLDVPLWYILWHELRMITARDRGLARLAAALNGYPTLLLATLLLATSSSLELGQLARPPALLSVDGFAHWAGAIGFSFALPAVVGVGPFAVSDEPGMRLGLRLRAVGFWAIASLFWMTPLQDQIWQVLPPMLLAALLCLFHQFTHRQPARTWARSYVVLAWLLLLVLLVVASWQLGARLR